MNAVTWWADLQRLVAARRRLVAAFLVALAVLSALSALRPAPPATVPVLAAARDLAPGVALTLDDLRTVPLPPRAVPSGALRPGAPVLGRVVAGPVRQGEPLTDVRLVGPSLLAAANAAGSVAVPVRFADAGAVALLRPGDRIDVLAVPNEPLFGAPGAASAVPPPDTAPADPAPPGTPPAGAALATPPPAMPDASAAAPPGTARVVAANVVVLAVPAPDATGFGEGALVVVACTPPVARALAAAAASARLSPALLPATAPPAPPPAPPPLPVPAAPSPAASAPSARAPTSPPEAP